MSLEAEDDWELQHFTRDGHIVVELWQPDVRRAEQESWLISRRHNVVFLLLTVLFLEFTFPVPLSPYLDITLFHFLHSRVQRRPFFLLPI